MALFKSPSNATWAHSFTINSANFLQNSSGIFQGPEGMSSTALSASSRIRSFMTDLRDWGVWVGACTLFWAVPHGHETASPNQTVLDVDAGAVVAVQKILAS
jgi:hypothetical protein